MTCRLEKAVLLTQPLVSSDLLLAATFPTIQAQSCNPQYTAICVNALSCHLKKKALFLQLTLTFFFSLAVGIFLKLLNLSLYVTFYCEYTNERKLTDTLSGIAKLLPGYYLSGG